MAMQSNETLLIRFSVTGTVCYLSQQETLTMWRRCLARAGISVSFSQGFNPHPKISLPLPRSVGVEGDEEILSVGLCDGTDRLEDILCRLNQRLPRGCSVWNTERFARKVGCRPISVLYVVSPQDRVWQNDLSPRLERCRAAIDSKESLVVYRYGPKHKTGHQVDIGTYFQALEWDEEKIYVRCRFTPEGTARVEEILTRFGLEHGDMVRPVLRTKIEWQMQ
jgi:radical SAM-linked protein